MKRWCDVIGAAYRRVFYALWLTVLVAFLIVAALRIQHYAATHGHPRCESVNCSTNTTNEGSTP